MVEKRKIIDDFIEVIEDKNLKVTFGLQPNHINTIEKELLLWNTPLAIGEELYYPDGMWAKAFWDRVAKILGWCPFTLTLYYLEYKSKLINEE